MRDGEHALRQEGHEVANGLKHRQNDCELKARRFDRRGGMTTPYKEEEREGEKADEKRQAIAVR